MDLPVTVSTPLAPPEPILITPPPDIVETAEQAVTQEQPIKSVSFCLDTMSAILAPPPTVAPSPAVVPSPVVAPPPIVATPPITTLSPVQQQLPVTPSSQTPLQKDSLDFSFALTEEMMQNQSSVAPPALQPQSTLTVPSLEDGGVFAMIKVISLYSVYYVSFA